MPKFLPQAIFNSDGTVWYLIDPNRPGPEGYKIGRQIDLDPLRFHPTFMTLRITGESKNWYRVEANESTRAIRYIAKSDPGFFNVSWKFFLMRTKLVYVCNTITFLDKPNGKSIYALAAEDKAIPIELRIEDVDGDWIKVYKGNRDWRKEGWIKWRDGHDILVLSLRQDRDMSENINGQWKPCGEK